MTVNLGKELARRVIQASQDGNLTQDECDSLGIDKQTCKEVQGVVKIAQASPEFLNSLSGPGGMNLTKARAEFFGGKIKSLRADFNSGDPYMRYLAVEDLRKMGPEAEAALPDIMKALSDDDVRVVRSALYAVGGLSEKAIQEAVPAILGVIENWSNGHKLPFHEFRFVEQGPGSLMFAAKTLAKAGPAAVPEIVRFVRDNLGDGGWNKRCLGLAALIYMRKAGVDISAADSLLREIEDGKCQTFLAKDELQKCIGNGVVSNSMLLAILAGGMADYNLARAALGKSYIGQIYADPHEWISDYRPGSL